MANPLICVFNPVTSFIDEVQSISTGPAAIGVPIVTNLLGVIDTSLLGIGVTATAGQAISSGTLVNLYSFGGTLHAQIASAQGPTFPNPTPPTPPSGGSYPLQAQGFAASSASLNQAFTVSFFGTFKYVDGNSEFNAGTIGQEVYLSDRGDGSITLTPPSGLGELEQSVGYVVSFTTPNIVIVNFASGFQDFSHISGVNPIAKGGTGATTAPQALINLIGGSPSSGQALVWNGSAWTPATVVTSFSAITTGTNSSATMTVGTGASLTFSGSGVINANQLTGDPVNTAGRTPGQVLTWSGTSWAPTTVSATPGAPSSSVQFNNSGVFGGSANFEWDNSNNLLSVVGDVGVGTSGSAGQVDAIVLSGILNTPTPAGGNSVLDVAAISTVVPTTPASAPTALGQSIGFRVNPSTPPGSNVLYYGSAVMLDVPSTNVQPIPFTNAVLGEIHFASTGVGSVEAVAGDFEMVYASASGSIASLIGMNAIVSISGGGTVSTNSVGVYGAVFHQGSATQDQTAALQGQSLLNSTGNINSNFGLDVQTGNGGGTGTVTNDYTIFVDSPQTAGLGTLTHHYGLYIANQATNPSKNPDPYAIKVVGGVSQFTGVATSIVTKTSLYTATADDYTILADTTSAPFTIHLPIAGIKVGQTYRIKNIGNPANLLTIDTVGGATNIDFGLTQTLAAMGSSMDVQWNGTQWWIL